MEFTKKASQKIEFNDWSRLSSEMIKYMAGDVNVTHDLYHFFKGLPEFPSAKVLALEHYTAAIIQKQEEFGFHFNIAKARTLNMKLNREQIQIEHKLLKTFKPRFLPDGPVQKTNKLIKRKSYVKIENPINTPLPLKWIRPWKVLKNGKTRLPAKTKFKFFKEPHRLVIIQKNGEFQNIKLTRFTATDNQIKVWLKAMYGFEFNTYTDKGNIRVDRDDLEALGDYGKELRRLMKVKKDLSQLHGDKGLIPSYREATKTITSNIDTNGTITGRFTSSGGNPKTFKKGDPSKGVNLNQIPAQTEFRELFDTPETTYEISEELYKKLLSKDLL